jgi:hypothetical protein
MTTPEPDEGAAEDQADQQEVPPAAPAYSTPPPDGVPDAEHD